VPIDGSSLAGLPVLIVNPGVPLATAEVFGGWDGIDRGALAGGEALTVAAAGRNDLEAAATALVPEIAAILDALRAADGNILARMSGSGATCFALFAGDAERDAASRALGADFPDWWFLASRLR
jgi:4-diphosphocytidyl-2-C-methyl-D-erythritol kinase